MYKQSFGSIGQVQFENEHEYYRLLGYLAKSDGSTELAWERNEEQGAWLVKEELNSKNLSLTI